MGLQVKNTVPQMRQSSVAQKHTNRTEDPSPPNKRTRRQAGGPAAIQGKETLSTLIHIWGLSTSPAGLILPLVHIFVNVI